MYESGMYICMFVCMYASMSAAVHVVCVCVCVSVSVSASLQASLQCRGVGTGTLQSSMVQAIKAGLCDVLAWCRW